MYKIDVDLMMLIKIIKRLKKLWLFSLLICGYWYELPICKSKKKNQYLSTFKEFTQ